MEENLDAYRHSGFDDIQNRLNQWEAQLSDERNEANRNKLVNALNLLKLHTQTYQHIVITRRRRLLQKRRTRQMALRNFFLQMMEDLQVKLVEMLPLRIEPSAFLDMVKEESDEKLREWESTENKDTIENFGFFQDIVSNFTEEQWLDTFHMTKNVFELICSRLKPVLLSTNLSLEELTAMSAYTLATGSTFRSVGMLFNKPQTYVRSALYKFIQAFLRVFEKEFLGMPKNLDRIANICKEFSRASHMPPCCVGVLTVFELPTFAYTSPGFKSYGMDRVIVQVLIDDRLWFRKVEVAHQNPEMLLRKPNSITELPDKSFADSELTHFVVAPPQYPLRSWLMQKFDEPSDESEHDFNEALSHLNIFRELALKRLFGRWQILSSSEFIEPESKSLIAKACCVLHNILENTSESYSEDWSENTDLKKYEFKFEPSATTSDNNSKKALEKRIVIARLIQSLKNEKTNE